MKHKTVVVIGAERATVWRLFDDAGNLRKWQPTLKSVVHRSGTPGQPDAVTELTYDEGGREVVITETITARREPDFLAGTYESRWGGAVVVNQFEDASDGGTRWTAYHNQSFTGLMKVLSLFRQRAIVSRIDDDAERFKLFVETSLAGGAT
jgi:uncharacterized protein YndB with AHSA1/START domain